MSSEQSLNEPGVVASSNPYAVTIDMENVPLEHGMDVPAEARTRSIWKILLRCALVCGVSAIPSFFVGLMVTSPYGPVLMAVGVLVFTAIYAVVDYQTYYHPLRSSEAVRWALRIGYGSRLFISILFPFGAILDSLTFQLGFGWWMFRGVDVEEPFLMNPIQIVFLTLGQGVLMNVVLYAYILVAFLLIKGLMMFFGSESRKMR